MFKQEVYMSEDCEKCGEHCLDCSCDGWTSVEDCLPEEYKVVLVINENSTLGALRAYYKKDHQIVNGYLNFDEDNPGFFFSSDFPLLFPLEVTHWKEMPELEEKA